MTKHLHVLALVFAFALASTAIAQTQEKPALAPAAKAAPSPTTAVPLKVQVLISRYQGEKKISSMPYNLSINANPEGHPITSRANLRMGSQVPIVSTILDAKGAPPLSSYQYRDIGTNIDCTAAAMPDGRFRVEVTVDDSSIYPDEPAATAVPKGTPSFRSFRASDSMMLKDGQTTQFTAATDKVNGETVRVDVTLTVMK